MASKKASASSPVRVRTAADRAGDVSGPVATITLSQSAGGRRSISSRRIVTCGVASSAPVTAAAKALAVDRQRAAGRNLMGVAHAHDQGVGAAHFLM